MNGKHLLAMVATFVAVSLCLTACSSAPSAQPSTPDNPVDTDQNTTDDGTSDNSTDTDGSSDADGASDVARPDGWGDETHGKDASPGYDTVFTDGQVKRLDIVIESSDWQAMQDDMIEIYGEAGSGPQQPPQPRVVGGSIMDREPAYAPCTINFEDSTWLHVGIRYKGNSSLGSAWMSGNGKLPFRLDFDEFEDDYPEIDDQRFYGFKHVALSNGFSDPSLLREKVTHDIFRAAGLPAPRTAFYRVYIDHGEGETYFGLYTATEVPAEPMLEAQFGDSTGNLYKPEGNGASWRMFDRDSFVKKTNEDEEDWSDVEAAVAALHADRTDAATWRAGFEATFDVDAFLHWLAVNTVVQNWDTYGKTAQNYYVYADPSNGGRLSWFPWDLNEAIKPGHDWHMEESLSLDFGEIREDWPLIRYLIDDPTYEAVYQTYVQQTIDGAFSPDWAEPYIRSAHELIEPYVVGAEGEQDGYTNISDPQEFYDEVDRMVGHVSDRTADAQQYLATP